MSCKSNLLHLRLPLSLVLHRPQAHLSAKSSTIGTSWTYFWMSTKKNCYGSRLPLHPEKDIPLQSAVVVTEIAMVVMDVMVVTVEMVEMVGRVVMVGKVVMDETVVMVVIIEIAGMTGVGSAVPTAGELC